MQCAQLILMYRSRLEPLSEADDECISSWISFLVMQCMPMWHLQAKLDAVEVSLVVQSSAASVYHQHIAVFDVCHDWR